MWCVVSVLKRSSQRRTVFIKVKSLEMSLTNYKEDHASTSKELSAVLDYLEKLKPQCETKVMTSASGDRIRPENQSRNVREPGWTGGAGPRYAKRMIWRVRVSATKSQAPVRSIVSAWSWT